MLSKSKAFSGFSTSDVEKAKSFYQEVLGLDVRDNSMGMIKLHLVGNQPVIIYPKEDHQPATYTVLNFVVSNIDDAVDVLTDRGVEFLQYEGDLQTDQKGICRGGEGMPHIAWFEDPAGNILSVLEDHR